MNENVSVEVQGIADALQLLKTAQQNTPFEGVGYTILSHAAEYLNEDLRMYLVEGAEL